MPEETPKPVLHWHDEQRLKNMLVIKEANPLPESIVAAYVKRQRLYNRLSQSGSMELASLVEIVVDQQSRPPVIKPPAEPSTDPKAEPVVDEPAQPRTETLVAPEPPAGPPGRVLVPGVGMIGGKEYWCLVKGGWVGGKFIARQKGECKMKIKDDEAKYRLVPAGDIRLKD